MDIQKDTWIWVVVQDPGGNEAFLGQHDEVNDISFIPAFLEKEEAQGCLEQLVMEAGKKVEAQAIRYGFLSRYAGEHGFTIFILNSKGEVLQMMDDHTTGTDAL